jgi:solute carrier family 50 protein (sugar transporter)
MGGGSLFFPILGVILSNVLYFAPAPAVLQACQTGSLGSLNVLPLALMVTSTTAWMSYALSVPNPFIMMSNFPGCVASFAYVSVALPLIPRVDADRRRQVQLVLVASAFGLLSVWSFVVFGELGRERGSFMLGAYGSTICVILFASPLSTAFEVVQTGNAVSIYVPLTVAQCTNCLTWTIYGFSIGDVWVWGPNGVGLLLGVLQMLLVIMFPSYPKTKEQAHLVSKETSSDAEADSETGSLKH